MGCFSACFGRCSKRYSKIKKSNGTEVFDQKIELTTEAQIADPLEVNEDNEEENEEQLNSNARKKVAFDSTVKIDEENCENESSECSNRLPEGEKGKESGTRKRSENELRGLLSSSQKEDEETEGEQGKNQPPTVLSDSSEKEKPQEEEKTSAKQSKNEASDVLSDSSQSSLFTYPLNNRYENCATSDDEFEDSAIKESNLVDEFYSNYRNKDGHEGQMIQGESSESLFSLSIDSRRQSSTPENGDKEVNSPFKPCNRAIKSLSARYWAQNIDCVLNPIENLSQRKATTTITTSSLKNQQRESDSNSEEARRAVVGKENLYLEKELIIPASEEPTLKQSKRISSFPKDDVIAVDASLSSWLIESENTPVKENSPGSVGNSSSKRMKSPKSFEDRLVLGALALDELKQMSRHSSPRRSPSFSPHETPIIGTVGSYWRHTGQAADADSGISEPQGRLQIN